MRFSYENKFDSYTPTVSSEDANYPATNAQDIHLSKLWKTDGVASTSNIVINAGTGETIVANCAAIVNHSMTASCAAYIQAHTADSWGTPDLDESITVQVDDMMLLFFATTTKQYWRFYFETTALTAAMSVGRLWLGEYVAVESAYNSNPEFPERQETTDLVSFNRSGQIYASQGVKIKSYRYVFPRMNNSAKTVIETLWDTVGRHTPFIFTNFDTDYSVVKPVYVSIDRDVSFDHLQRDFWKTSLSLRENK